MPDRKCVIIFVKYPEKGNVKSRLAVDLDDNFILDLYQSFVEDLLSMLKNGDYTFKIAFHPAEKKYQMVKIFGNEYFYIPQRGSDLGERMKNAFVQCFSEGFDKTIIIGSDTPDLRTQTIEDAFHALDYHDSVLGPSYDGGYYLIGFNRNTLCPDIFRDIKWSTDTVFCDTVNILNEKDHNIHTLPQWRDIDRFEDLKAFTKKNKGTSFRNSKTMRLLIKNGF